MEKEKKLKITIGVLVLLLIVSIGVIVVLVTKDKKEEGPSKNTETKEVEKKEVPEEEKEENEEEKKKNNEEEKTKENKKYKIKKVLFDTTSYGNDDIEKVELTDDGIVLVSMTGVEKEVKRKEVLKDVTKTFEVRVGQSDICEGNKRIMFVHKDGTASYLNIDELTCWHSIVVNKISGLKNVDKFEEKVIKHEGEPNEYVTYVITKDGEETDISQKLN